MKRTQIQLPETLYDQVKRLAEEQEWSIAEVLRRGAEYMVGCYPPRAQLGWTPPCARPLGDFKAPCDSWRDLAEAPEGRL
ncbi:MAG: CopG family transcriptional regulator [Vulcanimicrobiota bacterium]